MEIKKVNNKANKVMSDRRSVKRYDKTVKISREEMSSIIQDALTAPSSFNLQPWRFVVVETPEGKEAIRPYMMFNEKQWETSSAIIAIFADMDNVSTREQVFTSAHENGLMVEATKNLMIDMVAKYLTIRPQEQNIRTAIFDCGLVTMQLMLSAKNHGYDTNAIGGFEKEEVSIALGIDTDRYLPVLLLSIGKAADSGHESIRYTVDEVTQWK